MLTARFEGGSTGLGFARKSAFSFHLPQGIQNVRRFSEIHGFPPENCSRLVLRAVLCFQRPIAPQASAFH
ncbi:hypothetical protein K1719_034352 [Acacia pycnantha]|nr:hypothetical protein K1719_034352 [Acacia pycnantha]